MTEQVHKGWIGVDLDGTLAYYDGWKGTEHIGAPIQPMVARVKRWLAEGRDVRIFTARIYGGNVALKQGNPDGEAVRDVAEVRGYIEAWCLEHLGQALPVQNVKDYAMAELWDDRAYRVVLNEGVTATEKLEAENERLRGLLETIENKLHVARANAIDAVHLIVRTLDGMVKP